MGGWVVGLSLDLVGINWTPWSLIEDLVLSNMVMIKAFLCSRSLASKVTTLLLWLVDCGAVLYFVDNIVASKHTWVGVIYGCEISSKEVTWCTSTLYVCFYLISTFIKFRTSRSDHNKCWLKIKMSKWRGKRLELIVCSQCLIPYSNF